MTNSTVGISSDENLPVMAVKHKGQCTNVHRPEKIISGGQSGADIGGLVGAKRVGIATGGTAPKGYRTEKGAQPEALKSFGLAADTSPHYKNRTLLNVIDSDATIVFSRASRSSGTELTIRLCEQEGKPYCVLERLDDNDLKIAMSFIGNYQPKILNVAGNRESKSPGIAAEVAGFIERLLG